MELKQLVGFSAQVDFTSKQTSTGAYIVSYALSRPAGTNYVVNLTGYSYAPMFKTKSPPTSIAFYAATFDYPYTIGSFYGTPITISIVC